MQAKLVSLCQSRLMTFVMEASSRAYELIEPASCHYLHAHYLHI
jgi:hypothetical protein